MAESIQFWLAIATGVAVFGATCFFIGVFVGIRSEMKEQNIARTALSVGGNVTRR